MAEDAENNEIIQTLFNYPWYSTCTCPPYISRPKELDVGPNADRKRDVLKNVFKTEVYLKEHRIDELLQYLFTKLLSAMPNNPLTYLENVLEECMLFRAGHGNPPVIYDNGHLEAVIKSFDPGQRGWLNVDQIKQIFVTIGLPLHMDVIEKMSVEDVLQILKQQQSEGLYNLLSAGTF